METKFSHYRLWDTHMHSQFSGDSEAPQEEMISSAIEKGLAGICFTDHLDIDYPEEPDIFLLDLPNYTSSVLAYQEKYAAKLPVTPDDLLSWIWVAKTVLEAAGVQLDPFSEGDKFS